MEIIRTDYKEKIDKKKQIGIALVGLIMGISIGIIIAATVPQADPEPKTGQVVEKFMAGDTHFLQLTIAVSPEEYIGYDIGDEYEVQK